METKADRRENKKRKEKFSPQGSMSRNVHLVNVLQKGRKNLSRTEKKFYEKKN